MELKWSYLCRTFMRIYKLKVVIILILIITISTNVINILLKKPLSPKGWLDAYSYGLVFDFSPRWRK